MDEQVNYPVGFYFELMFEGVSVAFQEVSGISKELGMEEVAGGGENRFKHRLPTISSSQNLILKRALVPEGSELVNWCSSTIENGLTESIKTHDASVKLIDAEGKVLVQWTFFDAYPVKYSISDLKSTENELVLEELELAYTYFDISSDTSFSDLFDG